MNWNMSKWWMAQAPGPQAITQAVTAIQNATTTIKSIGEQSLWESSWNGIWTPLPEKKIESDSPTKPSASVTPSPSSNKGLSTSAKIGLSLGIVGLALVAAFLAAFFLFNRRKLVRRKDEPLWANNQYSANGWAKPELGNSTRSSGVTSMMTSTSINELEQPTTYYEMPASRHTMVISSSGRNSVGSNIVQEKALPNVPRFF